jgi:hypothetical protein|tara:strand:+ start:1071 stop:3503 length:2433 start_codon:yes stop_codon:yes gene_type:complete
MAERIVSPGVFTRERDLSFLPQGISEIGAAIIGPTDKGPAFTPTVLRNFSEFEEMFGGMSKSYYTPYAVQQYLRSAGSVTIIRVLGIGGYRTDFVNLQLSSSLGLKTVAVLAPSRGGLNGIADISATSSGSNGDWSSFDLVVSGSDTSAFSKTISFNTSSADYIDKVLSSDPQVQKSGQDTAPVYLYKNFKSHQSHAQYTVSTAQAYVSASVSVGDGTFDFTSGVQSFDADGNANSWTGNSSYSVARTPYVQSQRISGARYSLFRVYTRSHGSSMSSQFKVSVLNVKDASAVAGSDYGTFSVQIRRHAPGKVNNDQVVEQFDSLTFDPSSANYFARRIGSRFVEIDSNGKLTYKGDWPNMSKHIRVGDFADVESMPMTVVPMGHAAVVNPVLGTASQVPTASFQKVQENAQGSFDGNIYYGFKFGSSEYDNHQYLSPIPLNAAAGNNVSMSLEDMYGHASAADLGGSTYADGTEKISLSNSHLKQRKFVVPFQWGFDGANPATPKNTANDISATNTMGFDCSNNAASGTIAYKRAINAISNPDEFDINLLVMPGIIHQYHPKLTNHAIEKMEDRGDALFVMDGSSWSRGITNACSDISTLDTNYAATYYPWVKILDDGNNLPVWVPPSVVLPGVIAYTDRVAHEWFAPAGLNRGGLTTVLEAKTRLTHAERDELYEGRLNPIASFPGQGVVVWGQKTLQSKPSALDRVNVRRLLIKLKKFIASSSRYLVFEQNDATTRNRFMNIVNPFLESVQANSGLSAFKVVMDDSNNPPDVVDRNQLVGQIFIQPTRTAEFIVLDFVILPTGATFPE